MKAMKKGMALVLCLVLCVTVLTGCGGSKALEQIKPQEGKEVYTLTGECTAEVKDGKITIYLTSNLLEGTVACFSVDSYDGEELVNESYAISGETVSVSFDIPAEWEGKAVYATVTAAPSLAKQPGEVTDVYGRYFQNIDGENIIWNKTENIFIAQSGKIEL